MIMRPTSDQQRLEVKSEPLLSLLSSETIENKNAEKHKKRCFSWPCCCLMCVLLVVSVAILGVVGLLLMQGRMSGVASVENSLEWEQRLRSSLDSLLQKRLSDDIVEGVYQLISFDQNYELYLKSLGLPFFVVPIILASAEILKVQDLRNNSLLFTTKTDFDERSSVIKIDELFELPWGKNSGFMHIQCTRPRPNVLHCDSEERVKQWRFEAWHEFSDEGIIQTRTFFTKNITMKKFYRKVGGVDLDIEDVQGQIEKLRPVGMNEEEEEEESPFSIDADEDFFDMDLEGDDDEFW